jgi:hypothetical protein
VAGDCVEVVELVNERWSLEIWRAESIKTALELFAPAVGDSELLLTSGSEAR